MFLTEAELVALTRRNRPGAQARVLRQLGVPFRAHPTDGVLLVLRVAAERALGAESVGESASVFEVNLEGMRKHGATSSAH